MAGPTDDIQKDLDALDKRLSDLKITYDKYFLGMERFEPIQAREDVGRMIIELSGRFIRNTGAKFRRDSLKSKFLSYSRYWDRILKQIEEGTYKGHKVKAELHERERLEKEAAKAAREAARNGTATENTATLESPNGAARPAAPMAAAAPRRDPVQTILDQFVAAKRKAGESADGLTRDKMAAVIQQQSAALKAKYNCKSVEFRVVVENGKAKLKAIPKS